MGTPMRSFTADRLKPKWADLIVVLLLLVAVVALVLALRPEKGGELTAVVKVDGVEVARRNLEKLEDSEFYQVEGVEYPIEIEFAPGKVRIHKTACPSRDCYATGWVDWAGGQIVCLPNRIAIDLQGEKTSDIDAISG